MVVRLPQGAPHKRMTLPETRIGETFLEATVDRFEIHRSS